MVNPLFLLLTAAILLIYAWSLWRLLRSESSVCLWSVAVLTAVSLLLRLIEYGSYPGGLNDDEPKVLYSAINALKFGDLFGQGLTGLPQLIPVLFEAQLVPLIGAGRWSIRLYSILGSVFSVAATFAVARGMRMRPISSLVAAALVVFLPWSLLYGRISQGGELLFNQALLLASLARLVWRDGSWREVPGGATGLCLLFYDYFSGRSMLAMPFVAAVLARGRRRLTCLAVAAVAMLGFLPYAVSGHQYALVGLTLLQVHSGYSESPLATLWVRLANCLTALAYPTSSNGWMTVSAAGVHPWIVLALAALGVFTGFRRGLFLLAGFLVGLMPSIVAHGDLVVSAHRMHAAYIFVALSAGASFELIPWRSLRAAAATALVAFVAAWSITFYFSDQFWKTEARWMFGNDSTDVVESIPWGQPNVVESDLGYYIAMRTDLEPKRFGLENLSLPGPALYVFSPRLFPLQEFYRSLFPPGAVNEFGRAFSIRVNEWPGLAGHGWSYTVRCGELTRSMEIPMLFHFNFTFSGLRCAQPAEHVWRARWRGPPRDLRLWFIGAASVETAPGDTVVAAEGTRLLDFKVETGAEVTVRVSGPPHILAALYGLTRGQERVPQWEMFDPLPGA